MCVLHCIHKEYTFLISDEFVHVAYIYLCVTSTIYSKECLSCIVHNQYLEISFERDTVYTWWNRSGNCYHLFFMELLR